jgi:hypothetical protein
MAAIKTRSAWVQILSDSTNRAKDAFTAESSKIESLSGLSDAEKQYPMCRFMVTATYSADPGDNTRIDFYERMSDGTTQATVVDADNLQMYSGSFQIDNDGTDLTQEQFTRWFTVDKDSTFYFQNKSANSVNMNPTVVKVQMGSFE